MGLARSCALSAVATLLAVGVGRKAHTVRQQLREFCYEAQAKRGAKRQALAVESCFAPLLGWGVRWGEGQPRALARAATALGARFVVLPVRVVSRGCALPVAWTVVAGNPKHAWRGEWLRRLRQLRPAIPATGTVIGLADRGLDARGLYRRRVRLGWQPFLRINTGGTFRPQTPNRCQPLRPFAPHPGTRWQGRGTAFVSRPSRWDCPLLACGEAGYKDAWCSLTDLPPESSEACWYGWRAWIAPGFQMTNRGGGQWQRTRMTDPARAARLWLAVAVATLWLLSGGGEAEASVPPSTLPDLREFLRPLRRQRRAPRLRLVSIFRHGWNLLLGALLNQRRLPTGRFIPEAWPTTENKELNLPVIHHMPLAA
jgi:hypothetical protein